MKKSKQVTKYKLVNWYGNALALYEVKVNGTTYYELVMLNKHRRRDRLTYRSKVLAELEYYDRVEYILDSTDIYLGNV